VDFSTKASNAETMVAWAEASPDEVIPTIILDLLYHVVRMGLTDVNNGHGLLLLS